MRETKNPSSFFFHLKRNLQRSFLPNSQINHGKFYLLLNSKILILLYIELWKILNELWRYSLRKWWYNFGIGEGYSQKLAQLHLNESIRLKLTFFYRIQLGIFSRSVNFVKTQQRICLIISTNIIGNKLLQVTQRNFSE